MNIILCGLPMSGKTTLGRCLAQKLHRPFIDIDTLIEQSHANTCGTLISCRDIFLTYGERVFRSLEKQQMASIKKGGEAVISLGGGTFDDPENRELTRTIGFIVYLKATPAVIWERMQSRSTPAYLDLEHPEQAFYAIAEKRCPIYTTTSHAIINTDSLTPDDIVNEIILEVGAHG